MAMIGWATCPKDGLVYITDPKLLKIWLYEDEQRKLVEATCPTCGATVEGRVPEPQVRAFISYGVEAKPYSEKLEPLTEELIDSLVKDWDLDAELAALK